jgi:hypothetical protein
MLVKYKPMEKEIIPRNFSKELLKIGIMSYDEHETLWKIAKRCARTTGITVAIPTAMAGAAMGSISIPGVGAVPGVVAGALAGFVGGTTQCVTTNSLFKTQLRLLISGYNSNQSNTEQ